MAWIEMEENFPPRNGVYKVKVCNFSTKREALASWTDGEGFELLNGELGEAYIDEWWCGLKII